MNERKELKGRKSISWHIYDLLGRDIAVCMDVVKWLAPKQRDIARKARPKRLACRYLAAQAILSAAEGSAPMLTHLLERTEGKVAGEEGKQGPIVHFHFGELRPAEAQHIIEGELSGMTGQLPDLAEPQALILAARPKPDLPSNPDANVLDGPDVLGDP